MAIRYASADDIAAIAELDGASFGYIHSESDLADALIELADARIIVAEDDGRIVGTSGELPFHMTLPGGGSVRAAGITWVSVDVTHRRRGILRVLIEQQLRDQAAAGFAAAILTASEGGIYGRYGFGVAERVPHVSVERHRAVLREPVVAHAVRRLPTEQARSLLPEIYERWRRRTPGAIDRLPSLWRFTLLDRDFQRGGASGLFHLVHPDGYVSYRIVEEGAHGLPHNICRVVDYAPVTAQAHAELWQVLLGNDLVGRIESIRVPMDDPLPLLLTNPRHVRTESVVDGVWVRPIDVPTLLSTRTYAVEVDVVLGVEDALFGDARYRLRGGPDGASCERTDAGADATLGVAQLGAVLLGGIRLAMLARAGLVAGDGGVIGRLDRALLADRLPSAGTPF